MLRFLQLAVCLAALGAAPAIGERYANYSAFAGGIAAENDKDFPAAARRFREACEEGEPVGCSKLAGLYQAGLVDEKYATTPDEAKALQFFQRGCDGGDAVGCNGLGTLFYAGAGVKQNSAKAEGFFSKACDQGYAVACSNLGMMYDEDSAPSRNAKRATVLYEKACMGGDPNACLRLGERFAAGDSVPKDSAKALTFYRRVLTLDPTPELADQTEFAIRKITPARTAP